LNFSLRNLWNPFSNKARFKFLFYCFLADGQTNACLEASKQLLKVYPDHVKGLLLQADTLLNLKKTEEAQRYAKTETRSCLLSPLCDRHHLPDKRYHWQRWIFSSKYASFFR